MVRILLRMDRYLFRFGGEEFVVILPGIAEDEARRVAIELLGAVRAVAIPRDDLRAGALLPLLLASPAPAAGS